MLLCKEMNNAPASAAERIAIKPITDASIQFLFFCLIALTTKTIAPTNKENPTMIWSASGIWRHANTQALPPYVLFGNDINKFVNIPRKYSITRNTNTNIPCIESACCSFIRT